MSVSPVKTAANCCFDTPAADSAVTPVEPVDHAVVLPLGLLLLCCAVLSVAAAVSAVGDTVKSLLLGGAMLGVAGLLLLAVVDEQMP